MKIKFGKKGNEWYASLIRGDGGISSAIHTIQSKRLMPALGIIKYIIPYVYRLINGWIRLFIWGVCPKCNHDAPELYDCKICNYYHSLPRYKSDQTKEQKRDVWDKFISQSI